MAAQQTVKQSLVKISTAWPKDLIRPNHQIRDAIAQIADSNPSWSNPSPSAQEAKDGKALVGALERLLSNRAGRTYPNTDKVTKPPSMPKHYVNLMDGLRKAERGETEPWYKSFFRFRK